MESELHLRRAGWLSGPATMTSAATPPPAPGRLQIPPGVVLKRGFLFMHRLFPRVGTRGSSRLCSLSNRTRNGRCSRTGNEDDAICALVLAGRDGARGTLEQRWARARPRWGTAEGPRWERHLPKEAAGVHLCISLPRGSNSRINWVLRVTSSAVVALDGHCSGSIPGTSSGTRVPIPSCSRGGDSCRARWHQEQLNGVGWSRLTPWFARLGWQRQQRSPGFVSEVSGDGRAAREAPALAGDAKQKERPGFSAAPGPQAPRVGELVVFMLLYNKIH